MDRQTRRARYDDLRRSRPELFDNPPGAPYDIVTDPASVDAIEAELEAGGSVSSETGVVYEDPYVVIVRDAIRRADGSRGTYARQLNPHSGQGVVVLPLLDDDVVLIRHFRHSTRSWHWEFPRGFGEPDATAEQSVRRELREEIQAAAVTVTALGVVHPDSGLSAVAVALFAATIDGYGAPEAAEGIDLIRRASVPDVAAMIDSGEITDAFTIAAFLRAVLRGVVAL